MKLVLILCFFFAAYLCQTTVNIHNNAGGCGCGSNVPNTPNTPNCAPCPVRRFNVFNPFYGGSNDRVTNGVREGFIYEFWNEVRRRNSTFPPYVASALTKGTIKDDILDYLTSGIQDLSLEALSTQQATENGLRISINPFPFVSTDVRLFYSNLPSNGNGGLDCQQHLSCVSSGWCSGDTFESIAQYSISKGDIPIVFTFNVGSSRVYDAEYAKTQLLALGVKNVTLNPIPTNDFYQDMIAYTAYISTISPSTEINFISAVAARPYSLCQDYSNTTSLSVVTLSAPNRPSGFLFSNSVEQHWINSFNSILQQMINEHFFCQLGVKYYGYCNRSTAFWQSSQNYCAKVNWSGLPQCA